MWYNNKFFKYASAVLLILLIIYMIGKIDFFLSPFKKLLSTIFIPILVSSLFYYILRPLVNLLVRFKVPKSLAIIITFVVIFTLFAVISTYIGAIFIEQFNQLTKEFPKIFEAAKQKTSDIFSYQWPQYFSTQEFEQKISEFLEMATQNISAFVFSFISKMTSISSNLIIIPFILFYFLKDDDFFSNMVMKLIPNKHKNNGLKVLQDIDSVLSSYILGQMTVALAVGILMFIGYKIIGLKYTLVLSIFAMITCIIPFFGPWLGIIPALLIGLTQNPFMAIKIFIVMQVVQQIDNNLISPQVMRKRLDIHPLTVILLLMIGVSLYGFIGLIIIIPTYAALKVTIKNIREMYLPNSQ